MAQLSGVLLVDDDSTDNFLNELLINSMDIAEQVFTAESGTEALELLTDYCPSSQCPILLMVDVNMPGMNGIEFLEAYHRLPLLRSHRTVIVMLATAMHSSDLERLEELSIAGLVMKPLTKEKVETLLQLHFR